MTFDASTAVIGTILGIFGIVGLFGLVFGQFRRGVIEELRTSLASAVDEITIQRERGDRLEKELREVRAELGRMHEQLGMAQKDRDALQQVITMQTVVPQALMDSMSNLAGQVAARILENADKHHAELLLALERTEGG